ncbi:substrate-binding domain-containing protein [Gemmobacter lanyuensis]
MPRRPRNRLSYRAAGTFPKVVLAGEAQGEDSADLTRNAVLQMLKDHPALGAIYNVGGGNVGLLDALGEAGRAGDMLVIGHEVNAVTAPLLRGGGLDFAIAGDPVTLLAAALRHAFPEGAENLRKSGCSTLPFTPASTCQVLPTRPDPRESCARDPGEAVFQHASASPAAPVSAI